LARKEILARQFRRLAYSFLPERFCDKSVRILRLTNATFSNFISGQCVEACILGSLFAIAMSIFRMPYIPLICVLIAVTALIPIVGAFVGCVLGAFFILVNDPLQAVWFVIMFLALQQFENNVIYPKVVGKSVGLPGMWVLLAVTVGGELFGVAGMLLMIPLVSVLYSLLREITAKRLDTRCIDNSKLQDQPSPVRNRLVDSHKRAKEKRLFRKKSAEVKKARVEGETSEEVVINGLYSGSNSIADVAAVLQSEMPFIPLCYKTGVLFYSDSIENVKNSSASDIYFSIESYIVK
jgi:hypothetical protein